MHPLHFTKIGCFGTTITLLKLYKLLKVGETPYKNMIF